MEKMYDFVITTTTATTTTRKMCLVCILVLFNGHVPSSSSASPPASAVHNDLERRCGDGYSLHSLHFHLIAEKHTFSSFWGSNQLVFRIENEACGRHYISELKVTPSDYFVDAVQFGFYLLLLYVVFLFFLNKIQKQMFTH